MFRRLETVPLLQSLTKPLSVSYYTLFGFFFFTGDSAANLLQDEIAKEKQVFDRKL